MTLALRSATAADAELLARHRAAVWEEVGDWDSAAMATQIPIWATYFRRALSERTYLACLALDGEQVVGSGAILVHAMLPRPLNDSNRAGRVQSVYVVPQARRRGIARAIMERLLTYAHNERLISLSLHPSDEGRALYESLGFTAADEMRLNLAPDPKPQRPPATGRRNAR